MNIQSSILSLFVSNKDNLKEAKENRKAILLNYAEGAENWAHRDGKNVDEHFPYQAVVMLSKPGENFTGGEFYVAKQEDDNNKSNVPRIVRVRVEFQNPGDMVMFQGDHGMMPVKKGSSDSCERVAIGLFQKK